MAQEAYNAIYDAVGSADLSVSKGVYLTPGIYQLRIKKCWHQDYRKGGAGFMVEFEVLASTNPLYPVGSTVTWAQSFADADMAKKGLKEFVLAGMGKDPDAKLSPEQEAAINPIVKRLANKEGLLDGKVVNCEVVTIITKIKKTEFELHKFTPVATSA